MARHFIELFLLIVLTLAAASWAQDRLLRLTVTAEPAEDRYAALATGVLARQLQQVPHELRAARLAALTANSGIDAQLLAPADIAGERTLERLASGQVAHLSESGGAAWTLRQVDAADVVSLKTPADPARGRWLDWILTALFYAAIALVLMIWLWPLTRDLRDLEHAAAQYGNRNWRFEARIGPRSQVYRLGKTFRAMATRIDELIRSHRDLSNAVSHELRTPLARMQFEIELAQHATDPDALRAALANLKGDVEAIDRLVTATLEYAILERADFALNVGVHDFTLLVPALLREIRHAAPDGLRVVETVQADAHAVACDWHLMQAVIRNLMHNAIRYARGEVRCGFEVRAGYSCLLVDDDGPGVAQQDRRRVFDSFVQLEPHGAQRQGYGLGLAIVQRVMEWHRGTVDISESPLGGARFVAQWPTSSTNGDAANVERN